MVSLPGGFGSAVPGLSEDDEGLSQDQVMRDLQAEEDTELGKALDDMLGKMFPQAYENQQARDDARARRAEQYSFPQEMNSRWGGGLVAHQSAALRAPPVRDVLSELWRVFLGVLLVFGNHSMAGRFIEGATENDFGGSRDGIGGQEEVAGDINAFHGDHLNALECVLTASS